MSMSVLMDILLVLVFAICVVIGAKRGAFKAISGLLGTVLGFVAAYRFVDTVAPYVSRAISPFVRMAVDAGLDGLFTGEATSALGRIAQAAGATMEEALVGGVADWLAPMISFALIFLAVRVGVGLLCRMLSVKGIPLISTINKMGGAILGAVYGIVTVIALCWAILLYSPAEPQGLICQPVLRDSVIGGAVSAVIE